MKINIFLCEGAHDVAFLFRIFRLCGYSDLSNKLIKDLPELFKKYILKQIEEFDYQSGNLFGKPILPIILKTEVAQLKINDIEQNSNFLDNKSSIEKQTDKISDFVLLYGVGGIKKINETKSIIHAFKALLNSSTFNKKEKIECSVAFIIDADNEGVEKRTIEIKRNFEKDFTNLHKLTHNSYVEDEKFSKIGLYVFSNHDGLGKLEDIIFPLMKSNNEKIFDDAKIYFDTHFDKERTKKNNVEEMKSLIGISGQLQYSGVSNRDIIKQSDYLNEEKLKTDEKCVEIIEFINNFCLNK